MADGLIKIKHNKDMTVSDMKNAVMPLIQMCTDGLTSLNLRPPRPTLQIVWDVKIVFSYLEEKGLNNILPNKILSQKLLILLLLLGGQRMNTVFNFEVDNMFINTECAILSPNKVLKH